MKTTTVDATPVDTTLGVRTPTCCLQGGTLTYAVRQARKRKRERERERESDLIKIASKVNNT